MRRRLLASMVLVTIVAVVVFGGPLGVAAARLYRGREVSRLGQQATRAAGAMPASGLEAGREIRMPKAPPGVRLALYDLDGRRVAGDGPALGGVEVRAAAAGRVTDHREGSWLAVAVPLQDENEVVGAARAAVLWSTVTEDTHASWLLMAGLAALAVALAGAVAWWQSSRFVALVENVAGLAVRLGEGDFAARLAPSGVAELDRASDALNRTAGRLDDLLTRERSFTADVSHQLNTPLTSLRLGLESAMMTPDIDLSLSIEQALGEVDRLQATVTTLLAVARDALSTADEVCDVASVANQVAAGCRGPLASAGRPLRLDVDPDLPCVRCPAGVLREILSVLLENATIHGAGAVMLAARSAGAGVVIDVGDEGAGIKGDVETAFRRRPVGSGGHGIGLALARSLAEAHGARLRLTRQGPKPLFSVALAPAPAGEEPRAARSG